MTLLDYQEPLALDGLFAAEVEEGEERRREAKQERKGDERAGKQARTKRKRSGAK
jgi:hypothetical protein